MTVQPETVAESVNTHLGIAEQGKIYALQGDHYSALAYYREAMRLTMESGASEIFFRHYLESSLESLEVMESFQEVREYCDRAILHYEESPPQTNFARLDLASIYQRLAVVLLKLELPDDAGKAFEKALSIAELTLSRTLLSWLNSGFHITRERVFEEQIRQGYFGVKENSIDRDRALKMSYLEVRGQ